MLQGDEAINDDIEVRIYTPPYTNGHNHRLPFLVFLHGGGWHAGNLDTEDHICRTVCFENNCIVISVAYRLGPYVTFPTPIDDSYTTFRWSHQNAVRLSGFLARWGLGGLRGFLERMWSIRTWSILEMTERSFEGCWGGGEAGCY